MPRFEQTDMVQGAVSGFQYSGARPEKLGSSEYTLATLLVDVSGSVSGFRKDLEECVRAAVAACRASPRSENILLRMVAFNDAPREMFGFVPLADVEEKMLALPTPNGGTALVDAVYSAASAANAYGKGLYDQDYAVNAIAFVITDGDDNQSRMPIAAAKDEAEKGRSEEWLESSEIALIGVNAQRYDRELNAIASGIGLAGYMDAGDATPSSLAKLARFISKSISSASQSLVAGSGSGAGLSTAIAQAAP